MQLIAYEVVMVPENFIKALRDLGKNDTERGRIIGVSPRTVYTMRNGKLPVQVQKILHPALLRGLLLDLEMDPPQSD